MSATIKQGQDLSVEVKVYAILASLLGRKDSDEPFDKDTALLGSFPELDSMAVVNLITDLEEEFGFFIEDDEISAETFETFGSLCAFVEGKLGQ